MKKPRIPLSAPPEKLPNPFDQLDGAGLREMPPPKAETVSVPKRQRLVLRRETAHRGGKAVVVVSGHSGTSAEIEALCRTIKARCGAGGTVKSREIEIQGDQAARVRACLEENGYRVDGV